MAYVTVGLVVLFSGLAFFDLRAVRDAQDQVFRERMALASSLAQEMDHDFGFLASDLLMGVESLDLSAGDAKVAVDQLSHLVRRHTTSQFFRVSFVGVMDDQGQLLASAPAALGPLPPRVGGVVRRAIAQNRPLILRSRRSDETGVPFAAVVVPVSAAWTGGQPLAVVADTIGVSGYLPAIPGGGTGYSMEVLGSDGRIIVSSPDPEQVGRTSPHYADLRKYINAELGGVEIHYGHESVPGGDQVVAITPFPSGPFYLVLKQPVELALAVPQRRQKEMMAVGVVGLMLALGVAWGTTRSVVRPVTQLRATARGFAAGNLENPVKVVAQDELGDLAVDIETMRQQLKRSRDDLEGTKRELEAKVAERTRRLQETLGKIITAQEEERRRLARELHDEQSQSLGALSVSLDRISRLMGAASPPVHEEMEQAREMARSLLKGTRRLIYDLRPSVLDDMGLEAAIRWCAETHLECHGVRVTLRNSLPPGRLPGPVEVALFRAAQEAIVNVERHSQARNAEILIERQKSTLRMEVRDDGRGFDPGATGNGSGTSGVGLEGMKERIHLVGGKIDVLSEPGKGATVRIEVPLDRIGAE